MDLKKYVAEKQQQSRSSATINGMGGKIMDISVYTGKGPDGVTQRTRPTQRRIDKNGKPYYVDENEVVVVDSATVEKYGGPEKLDQMLKQGTPFQKPQRTRMGVPDGKKGNGTGQGVGNPRQGRRQFYMGGVPTEAPKQAETPYRRRGLEPGKGFKRPYGAQALMLTEVEATGRPQFANGGVPTSPDLHMENRIPTPLDEGLDNRTNIMDNRASTSPLDEELAKVQTGTAPSRTTQAPEAPSFDFSPTSFDISGMATTAGAGQKAYKEAQERAQERADMATTAGAGQKAYKEAQERAQERADMAKTAGAGQKAYTEAKERAEAISDREKAGYGMVTEQDEAIYNRRLRQMEAQQQAQRAQEAQQMRQQGLSESEIQGRLQRGDVSRRQTRRDAMAQMAETGAARRAQMELPDAEKQLEKVNQQRQDVINNIGSMKPYVVGDGVQWQQVFDNPGTAQSLLDLYNSEYAGRKGYEHIDMETLQSDPQAQETIKGLYGNMIKDSAMGETERAQEEYLDTADYSLYSTDYENLSDNQKEALTEEYKRIKGLDSTHELDASEIADMKTWRAKKRQNIEDTSEAISVVLGPDVTVENGVIYDGEGNVVQNLRSVDMDANTVADVGANVVNEQSLSSDYISQQTPGRKLSINQRNDTLLSSYIEDGDIDEQFLNNGTLTFKTPEAEDENISIVGADGTEYSVNTDGPIATIDGSPMSKGMQEYLSEKGLIDDSIDDLINKDGKLEIEKNGETKEYGQGDYFTYQGENLQYDDGKITRIDSLSNVDFNQDDVFTNGDTTRPNEFYDAMEDDMLADFETDPNYEEQLDGMDDIEKAQYIADQLEKDHKQQGGGDKQLTKLYEARSTALMGKLTENTDIQKTVLDYFGNKSFAENQKDPFYQYFMDKYEEQYSTSSYTIDEIGNVHNKTFETEGEYSTNVRGFTQFPERDERREGHVLFKDPDSGTRIMAVMTGIATKGGKGGKRAKWNFELPNGQKFSVLGPGDHGDQETRNAQEGFQALINDIAYLANKKEPNKDGYQLTFDEDTSKYGSSAALNNELGRDQIDTSEGAGESFLEELLATAAGAPGASIFE